MLKTRADTLVLQIYYIVAALGSPYQGEHDPEKEIHGWDCGTKLKQLIGYSHQSKMSAVDHDFFE